MEPTGRQQTVCSRGLPRTKNAANPLQTLDGRGWLPSSVAGLNVLCLASGGGWQSILYAAAGANVTVVDLSESMLRLDAREARRRRFQVQTVHASMDDSACSADESFDIVHQPVSTCYVPDLKPVYAGIARVLRSHGLYISQHKQPVSLQISHRNERQQFVIGVEYYHEGRAASAAGYVVSGIRCDGVSASARSDRW